MSEEIGVTFKDAGLEDLVKALENNIPRVKVGVIGSSEERDEETSALNEGDGSFMGGDNPTNAEVGVLHEFGTENLPMRSFLRMPLTEKMKKFMSEAGAFNEETLKKIMEEKSFLEFAKKMGVVAETVVLTSFDTGGFGTWIPSNMNFKKNKQTLVETQQLRNSIASEVIDAN
jgi:hypothetical protein